MMIGSNKKEQAIHINDDRFEQEGTRNFGRIT